MERKYKVGIRCPACNGERYNTTSVTGIYTCFKCGAVHGTCYKGDSYQFVKPFWGNGEADHFFDLTLLGSKGIEHIHGWVNKELQIVQVG